MHFSHTAIATLCLLSLATACKYGEPSTSAAQLKNPLVYLNNQLCSTSGGAQNCSSKLVATQDTPDSSCPLTGQNHWWPIDRPATDCHGWGATDPYGRAHSNSANNITCSCDGKTVFYTQYPDSLDCSGQGHPKSYVLNECHQGMPPMLYDRGVDFSCCTPGPECATVEPLEPLTTVSPNTDGAANPDWIETARYEPALTPADQEFFVTVGMSASTDCSTITNRSILRLYVGPNVNGTCQGWNHYPNAYPNISSPHENSAINVRCVDGGIAYSQTPGNLDCSGPTSMEKGDEYKQCRQGTPPTVYTEILDFSGCLKQGFSPNATCTNKCDDTGECAEPTCTALVKEYPCDAYYAPGMVYAGWCDKECGYGSCAKAGPTVLVAPFF